MQHSRDANSYLLITPGIPRIPWGPLAYFGFPGGPEGSTRDTLREPRGSEGRTRDPKVPPSSLAPLGAWGEPRQPARARPRLPRARRAQGPQGSPGDPACGLLWGTSWRSEEQAWSNKTGPVSYKSSAGVSVSLSVPWGEDTTFLLIFPIDFHFFDFYRRTNAHY